MSILSTIRNWTGFSLLFASRSTYPEPVLAWDTPKQLPRLRTGSKIKQRYKCKCRNRAKAKAARKARKAQR